MRRTNLPATLMYLASSLLLLTVGGDYLIIFRGKSKHTSLVAPFNKWLLPEEELRNCYGSKFAEHFYLDIEPVTIGRGDTFRRLIARKADPLQCSSRSTPAIELQALMFASQKCVLLHGLYELWSEGNNVDEAVFKGEASIQYQTLLRYTDNANETASNVDSGNGKVTNRVSLNIAASVVEQPWLSSKELHKDILSKFQHMWHRLTLDQGSQSCEVNSKVCTHDFASNVEIDAKGGERGSDVNKKEFSTSSGDKRSSSSVLEMRIYVDDARGYCALCRQLTKGLAAPTNSGEGGRDPLPLTGSLRRPLSGVLNRFALKSLPFRTPTAMEPEIAFLIANLARVEFGTRVLDPFSGCGTLLMAAAHLQNMKPSATYMNAICELSDDSNIDDSTANHTKIATHGPQGETVVKDNFLLGVDANMGDISRIHDNFRAVQQSESIASLSLRWDLAESLLKDHDFSNFDTCTHSSSNASTRLEGLFDAIVTDPPYEMAEMVRSQRSGPMGGEREATMRLDIPVSSDLYLNSTDASQSQKKGDTMVTEAFIGKDNYFNEEATESPVRVRQDAATSSSAVGGVISTLLAIASKRLKVGGRLVFFVPHRDLDRAADTLQQESLTDCQNFSEESVRMNNIPVALSEDTTVIAGMDFRDINSKMAKRKAFKKKMNKGDKGAKSGSDLPPIETAIVMASTVPTSVDASECHINGILEKPLILLPTTAPLKSGTQNFLPPLPSNLVLLESYQQVMSPSFSRWLCVVEKSD